MSMEEAKTTRVLNKNLPLDEDAAKRSMSCKLPGRFTSERYSKSFANEKAQTHLGKRAKICRFFLRQFKRDIDTQLTKRKIEKTSDRDLEVSFASAQGDHEKVIAYFLDEKRDIDLTLGQRWTDDRGCRPELICDSTAKSVSN